MDSFYECCCCHERARVWGHDYCQGCLTKKWENEVRSKVGSFYTHAEVMALVNAAAAAAKDSGWHGDGPRDTEIYYCEVCKVSHEDFHLMEHKPDCWVRGLHASLKPFAKIEESKDE